MALTLNQIKKQIEDYGTNHPQINYVFFGEIYDRLSSGEVTYPAMFFGLESSQILAKQIQYTFSLYFMDRQLQETEGLEVLSDMTLVAQDLVAEMRNNTNAWLVGDTIPMQYFVEEDPDYLAGVRIDITLTLSSINNRCQIP